MVRIITPTFDRSPQRLARLQRQYMMAKFLTFSKVRTSLEIESFRKATEDHERKLTKDQHGRKTTWDHHG